MLLQKQKCKRPQKVSKFLPVLYQILDDESLNSINWNENGFRIENLEQFKENILPQHFKHNKYSSFLRQLNKYGFQIKEKDKNSITFVHPTINQTKRELFRNKERNKKEPFINFKDELVEMELQLIELHQAQAQIQKQIELSQKIMKILVSSIKNFSQVCQQIMQTTISSINYTFDFTSLVSRNIARVVPNAGGDILLHQIAAAQLAYPEYFESTFETPCQSVLSTPLPFYIEILKELVEIKDKVGK